MPGKGFTFACGRRTVMEILLPLMLVAVMAFPVSLAAQAASQTTPEGPSRSIQQDSQPASLANSVRQGEKNISGCLREEKGKFLLQNARHKTIWLTGPEDFAAHAGHTVTVYGNFLNTSASKGSAHAETDAHRSNQATDFQVIRMETISATCKQKSVSSENSTPR